MNTNEFIDTLEHELRLASQRRLRLAAARLPRPPAGAVAFTVALAVCALVAVPFLATRSGTTPGGHPTTHPGGVGRHPTTHPPAPRPVRVLVGCDSTVYGQLARGWRGPRVGTVVAGPLAWVYLRGAANPAAIHRSHFIQALAVVNPGPRVTVSIPRSEQGRISLDYTSVAPRARFYLAEGASAVTFQPCPRATSYPAGSRPQFDGGFIVSHPQCAEVDVHVAGEKTTIHREISLGQSCPGGRVITPDKYERRVLSGDGVGNATFGQGPGTVTRRLDALLGQPPTKGYSQASACRIDHSAAWPGLEVYFEHGRFVGYAYSRGYPPGRGTAGQILATLKGLMVSDHASRGRRLYGSAFRLSAAQGGSWSVKTPQGRIDGFTGGPGQLQDPIISIEAGYVGCPAMTP